MPVGIISPGITPQIIFSTIYDFMLVVLLRSIVNVTETCQVGTEGCRILRRLIQPSKLDSHVEHTS